ncbi:E3 ubiquitin-protein ligase RLIM-like [Pteronotus mesoamericanus]|uniref:E3 ubiquitin-protein ligase RLIM-like n=1 Tax=Pteronotus mesoamericanus TaxID=1884717 RepID=UPI0023ED2131|nr:E3 ubiquitin-protein ligase RLIM-like [Pteronotus parnellii mesoamericanus]
MTMENSDSGGEGDESEAQSRSQMDQMVQEDFYRLVNNLSEDDHKHRRGNNWLGNRGESTEELCTRRILIKENLLENSDESTDEGDPSDDGSRSDSLLDWLMSFEPNDNVGNGQREQPPRRERPHYSPSSVKSGSATDQPDSLGQTKTVTRGQREQPPRREVSQVNPPRDFRSRSAVNFNNGSPHVREEYTPSTRLPRGGEVKSSPSQVKNPQPQPTFTRPPRSEQSRPGALMEGPPTRGQKRERSRSPDRSRARARFESVPLPRSLGLLSQRPHYSPSSVKSGSATDQPDSLGQTKTVTREQREQPPRREGSQVCPPSDFRSSSKINFNLNNGSPHAREEYTPSTRLPRGGNVKSSPSQGENPQPQPRFTRPPRSEQSRPGALMEGPPTRGQKRERSRSPDHSRARARFESVPLPRSLGLLSQRPHYSPSSVKSGSATDQLDSFKQTKNTASGQREHQPWREGSQVNPHSDFGFSSEINVNFNNGGPNAREEYTPSTRLPRGGNMENIQRQVECPQLEPRFTRPPRSEQSRARAFMESPPTRGQKRERSRSPDRSRARARFESVPLPRSLSLLSQRPHHSPSSGKSSSITKNTSGLREHQCGRDMSQFNPHSNLRFSSEIDVNFNNGGPNVREEYTPSTRLPRGDSVKYSQRQVERPQPEPRFIRPPRSEQSRPRALIEVQPTRGQQTARSRSEDQGITRAGIERSPAQSLGELLQRLHHSVSSPTLEQPSVCETERFSRTQHHEILRQQITGPELQKRVLFANSETRNAIQGKSSPNTTSDGESCQLRKRNPTISIYSETGRVHPVAYCERESVTSRTQITSDTPNHIVTLESEQGELRHMFSHYEQGDMRAYVSTIGIPICRTLNTGLNDTTSSAIPSTLSPAMTYFSDSSNLVDSDSDSEPSFSPPSQNMEREESPSGSDSSHGSRGSGFSSTCSCDYCSHYTLTSSSDFSYMSTSSSSMMSSSSSSDESSDTAILLFDSSDESDFWPSPDDHPPGLSEAQIDNLAVRSSVKNDTLNECSICITEYKEGSHLRTLPCSHEFHVCCIDRWLSDNSTCPICRRNVADSGERENTN